MKLDPVFTVKENKLFKIDSNEQVDVSTLSKIELPWSKVEFEDEAYNEELLATLRDQLKNLELTNQFAILVPVIDKPLETPEQFELFTNAFNHAARRVKDCASVAGFLLPNQITTDGFAEGSKSALFMETLAIKHAQYVYFATVEEAPKDTIILL